MEETIWISVLNWGAATALVGMQLLGLVLAGRVILGNRSTEGTVAWVLSLVMLPLLAVPLYVIFGRNRLDSYIRSRRIVEEQFARRHGLRSPGGAMAAPEGDVSGYAAWWRILEDLSRTRVQGGHTVNLIFSGRATYAALIQAIEQATEYVLFQFFIFRLDPEGQRFAEALKAKAGAGVRVYFLVDAIGSRDLPRQFMKDMEAAGVRTGIFLPGRTLKGRLRVNFRNHRKVVVVDGRKAWIGGHNIGREYIGEEARFGAWRDTHVAVEGPVVERIQLAFLEDWFWVTRHMPELSWGNPNPAKGQARALCLSTGPTDPDEVCTLAFVNLINQAKRRLWIHSPYFVPGNEIIFALQLAALRGVDVRILLPGRPDHKLVWLSSFYFSALPELNRVRFFRYNPGFFHSKMLLVDDERLAVGTVNFDNRSFRINFEITLVIEDAEVIAAADQQMRADFAQSTEDPVDPLARRSIAFKLAARTARLLSPIL